MLKASIHTLGCRLNQSESNLIRDKMEKVGYEIVPFGEDADLAVINTCTVTNLADAKCRNAIRSFTRKNPEAFVAVVGCYSQMGYKAIAEIPGVDLIIGNQDKLSVLDFVNLGKNERPVIIRDRIDKKDFSIAFDGELPFPKRANLKVQDGCDFMCSFCIIPFARGRSRSRELGNLLEEARGLAERGVRELILTGVNIGTYDFENNDILTIVDRLNDIPGIDRIRISSIEPTTIPTELFDRMNDPEHALLPFLHIPLQSGSDRILREMRRKYTVSEYVDFIQLAYDSVPDLYLGTDIMVGYPGETDEEFNETCRVFRENPFAFCHVFTFSERDGTIAAKSTKQVPIPERARRSAALRRLSVGRRYDFYADHVGRTMRVLFEDPKQEVWPGYTDNYIRVIVGKNQLANPKSDLRNRTALVRLDRVCADFTEGTIVRMLD
ncbi:MAG TPA: tRNA (N(6)-L-threonylcarbamoyladenosine(37)-C(2))-methylthiotransferase MtaB [Opitutales bacterium]|nr:tRNA (N(6)-L-threonylcarbamoyladenosine(37)-C(2))-methylthiotransferase MtaB [Opitutales bacterium]